MNSKQQNIKVLILGLTVVFVCFAPNLIQKLIVLWH